MCEPMKRLFTNFVAHLLRPEIVQYYCCYRHTNKFTTAESDENNFAKDRSLLETS